MLRVRGVAGLKNGGCGVGKTVVLERESIGIVRIREASVEVVLVYEKLDREAQTVDGRRWWVMIWKAQGWARTLRFCPEVGIYVSIIASFRISQDASCRTRKLPGEQTETFLAAPPRDRYCSCSTASYLHSRQEDALGSDET
jgi:hypothetical protein